MSLMNKFIILLAFLGAYAFSGCQPQLTSSSLSTESTGTAEKSKPKKDADKTEDPQTEPQPEKKPAEEPKGPQVEPQPKKEPEAKAEDFKPNFGGSYQDLAKEFNRIIDGFSPKYSTLSLSALQEQALINFAKREDYKTKQPLGYFCTCVKVAKIRGEGMADLVESVEKAAEHKPAQAFFLFLGAGAAFTEFVALDALLQRNPELKIAMDFVDPIYELPEADKEISDRTKAMVDILMESLIKKYPGRILGYKMRADNFSKLPKDSRSLPFLLLPTASNRIKNSSIQNQAFSEPGKKIFVLAAFDLELSQGLSSYERSKEILADLGGILINDEGLKYGYDGKYYLDDKLSAQLQKIYQKSDGGIQTQFKTSANILENIFKDKNSWQIMGILVAEYKISVDNPLRENY